MEKRHLANWEHTFSLARWLSCSWNESTFTGGRSSWLNFLVPRRAEISWYWWSNMVVKIQHISVQNTSTVDGFVHCPVASTEGISCESSVAISSFFNHYLIYNPEINFQAILQDFSNIPLEQPFIKEFISFWGLGMPGWCSRSILGFS